MYLFAVGNGLNMRNAAACFRIAELNFLEEKCAKNVSPRIFFISSFRIDLFHCASCSKTKDAFESSRRDKWIFGSSFSPVFALNYFSSQLSLSNGQTYNVTEPVSFWNRLNPITQFMHGNVTFVAVHEWIDIVGVSDLTDRTAVFHRQWLLIF